MKIVLFANSISNSGGIERMTVSFANELFARGYKVSLILCGKDIGSFYHLNDKIDVYALGVLFGNRFKSISVFRKYIIKLQPDILINVAIAMGQISLPALIGIKKRPVVIAWEHFLLHAGSRLGYYFRLLSALVCRRTLVLTDKDRLDYPKWIQKKIIRIHNFTSYDIIRKDFLNTKKIVLTVGRLEKEKGFDELLYIWRDVISQQSKDWKLNIVGNGSLRDCLINLANRLGIIDSVDFIPATQAVTDYYKKSSVFVMTSRFEGLPMVLLEAKAFGIPSVSYDSPNGPSEIIQEGIDGYIVRYGDRKQFVTKLLSLMNSSDLQKSFSRAANLDVKKRFSVDVIIGQWIDLFNELQGNENTSCN